jgi:hypothetical protein
MPHRHTKRLGIGTFALIAATILSACQTAPEQDQMARTTTEVAPADLQLLCAHAAAAAAKADTFKTLPISSAKVDNQTYSVQVDAAGAKYGCMIDVNGVVKSVTPSA